MLTSDAKLDSHADIDGFHRRLYRTVERLRPAITDGANADAVARAVRILYARMERHFTVEEEIVAVNAPGAHPSLKADHSKLLAILWQLGSMPTADGATRTRLFHQFEAALARHDRELEGPLFSETFH